MFDSSLTEERPQTRGEEIANSVSHGVTLLLAAVAAVVLLVSAADRGSAFAIVGSSIFAGSMLALYGVSTVYHAWPDGRAKRLLQVLDHVAIFLLIAGTYTPFALGVLRGGWGWTLLGLVWSLSLAGILLKSFAGVRYPKLSLALYLATGWIAIVVIKPLLLSVEPAGLLWLLAGGVAYTGGVVFFVAERIRYSHFIWHLCTASGTACHFVAVLLYAW